MGTTLDISTELHLRLLAQAAVSPDREICGLLFGDDRTIATATACRNVAAEPATRFEIDPADLFAAHRAMRTGGPRLIGHFHSHPSGSAEPSPCDAESAAADGSVWLILGAGQARAWRAVEAGIVHGRFVPLGLRVGADRS